MQLQLLTLHLFGPAGKSSSTELPGSSKRKSSTWLVFSLLGFSGDTTAAAAL